uniref:Secreted protein n=1 Tax=Sinocyclocheilus rhinocerous TaxID=307959 RepID=A0A673IRN7_9TELE
MCPKSRSGMWKRTWMSSMTVLRCTTPVTAAQTWKKRTVLSATPNPNSGRFLKACHSPALRQIL